MTLAVGGVAAGGATGGGGGWEDGVLLGGIPTKLCKGAERWHPRKLNMLAPPPWGVAEAEAAEIGEDVVLEDAILHRHAAPVIHVHTQLASPCSTPYDYPLCSVVKAERRCERTQPPCTVRMT
eukprot:CAMPEP_0173118316 /NCGR_PEP_ID=MMETSP1102-20130122/50904_1 /TAXON_ID=49646 /ORGANISM="Geminigera sp., Strain Caron Lab Isolate" /LENGTH=122 /DNA_ID=CAMNT_0014023281 /DNA_START=430 /DNA_END=798 /DNA_ORIENTATION=+